MADQDSHDQSKRGRMRPVRRIVILLCSRSPVKTRCKLNSPDKATLVRLWCSATCKSPVLAARKTRTRTRTSEIIHWECEGLKIHRHQ
jgi:hypothetical protein